MVGLTIANPADGPGRRTDPRYVRVLRETRRRGIRILGYVTTDYGHRSLTKVTSEVGRWHASYTVDGIFFDEVPNSALHLSYCRKLYDYAKSEGGRGHLVVLNPGTQTLEDFMTACDILLNSESTWQAYHDDFEGNQGWVAKHPPSRFWHLVHGCPTEQDMQTALELARTRNAEWIFVTDGTGANPYGSLPEGAYWENQLRLASTSV